jgi:cytochrome c peroxidase
MKYLIPVFLFGSILILFLGFDKKTEDIQFEVPKGWPKPTYDFSKNKITIQGFELGRRLFYDPVLSRNGTTSCASCHNQETGFSNGINKSIGKRKPLSLANMAWNTSFMWDGGINHIEVQPLGPITSPLEMNNTLTNVVAALNKAKGYRSRFYLAFGDSTITGQHVLKALAQFLVMLESFNSKYDKYTRGEPGGAMTVHELNGLKLFRKHCESCHKEPLFTNYSFQNIGLAADTGRQDYGRMTITRDLADSMKFKVPSLRNVMLSSSYVHDGRFHTVMEVLNHYSGGMKENPNLAKELRKPIIFTLADKQDIIAFLRTLTDTDFINDKRFGDRGKY